jgi:hypothetical protein
MHRFGLPKYCMLLLLPLMVLHLHCGISLLHRHLNDSYHSKKDITHQLSTDICRSNETSANCNFPHSTSICTVIPAKSLNVEVPAFFTSYLQNLQSFAPVNSRPLESSPNKASPTNLAYTPV